MKGDPILLCIEPCCLPVLTVDDVVGGVDAVVLGSLNLSEDFLLGDICSPCAPEFVLWKLKCDSVGDWIIELVNRLVDLKLSSLKFLLCVVSTKSSIYVLSLEKLLFV